ncbi:succinylglutamate-semialdehyde dehydrogenase [Vibrio nitrifigilis]|uniref:N-succinylglutamate 5-semialdehyde dehydrogenase n=1 Tax=Vibrio nitrifigilis TaxID=2789781 RepID=A0ABS0GD83_9VIBR|nr:succinylglutamate-semialdehyde dehydrogenase [Vibrio nitrifigilis]MBF9000310.1 succinylglutamate-semialdehyde dehydrogenase [Vibrio nitrifigilis]
MIKTQPNVFTNGQWQTTGTALFSKTNPANGELVWQGHETEKACVEQVVSNARTAFKAWARTAFDERVAIVKRFAELVADNKQTLAETIANETGKPLWEALTEAQAMANKVAISITSYHERTGEKVTDIAGGTASLRHRPHGVMAVFGPYNFPGHLPNGHIVPALIAGNTIVFKPSELTPFTAQKTIELWEQAGLPSGVINLVQGGKDTGIALAASAGIDGLLFTGSANVGYLLHEQFATRPDKILALEMGGNNPLVIDSYDDTDGVVNLIIQSAFISAGQRCTCSRRLLVPHGEQGDALIARLVDVTKQIKVGAWTEKEQPFMGPVVSVAAAQHMLNAQDELIKKGAISLVKMEQLVPETGLLSPAILDVTNATDLVDEEYFGPLLTVIRYNTREEAIDIANNTRFGLSAGLVSKDKAFYEQFLIDVRAGIINWNKPLTGAASNAPFGGPGASGNHRPSAYYAADYCAWPVASLETDHVEMPEAVSPGLDFSSNK